MSDFVILLQKASRGPSAAGAADTLCAAVAHADVLYEQSKVLVKADLCPSGVAVLVAPRACAEKILAQGCIWNEDHSDIAWQAGSY